VRIDVRRESTPFDVKQFGQDEMLHHITRIGSMPIHDGMFAPTRNEGVRSALRDQSPTPAQGQFSLRPRGSIEMGLAARAVSG
jgi:hypothetical protein